MGRDKARIRLGGRSLLQRVRAAARATGLPVRTIRRDAIPKCGPLSGIFTGLRRAGAGWCLFLTCDMPLITPRLLTDLIKRADAAGRPMFVCTNRGFGFPLALPVASLPLVASVIASGRPALQTLAKLVRAVGFKMPAGRRQELLNANTPDEMRNLRQTWSRSRG